MDIKDFSEEPGYVETYEAANCMLQLNLEEPEQNALGQDASLASLMQSYISASSQSTTKLIRILGTRSNEEEITVDGTRISPAEQKKMLTEIASKQNLLSRQVEKSLQEQINSNQGISEHAVTQLISIPPETWGVEQKINDTSLKLINTFTGDSSQNETELIEFLRAIFTLAQTSNLSEGTAINILLRKLGGTAHILIEQHVADHGGVEKMCMQKLVAQLEIKFMSHCSVLSADQQLHNIKIGSSTYSQHEAKIKRLARLSTRMEKAEDRQKLTHIKECSAFLMSISDADRLILHTENTRRAQNKLSLMNLDMMSNCLIKINADKISYKDSDNVHQVNEPKPEHIGNVRDDNANAYRGNQYNEDTYNTRGGYQAQNKGGYQAHNKGGYQAHNKGGYQAQNRGGYQAQNRGGYQAQQNKYEQYNNRENAYRGNNRGHQARNLQRGDYQGNYNNRDDKQKQRKPFITTTMANVERNSCIMCGSPDHTFKQTSCPYYGMELQQNPCKFCLIGVHPQFKCVTRINPQLQRK